MRIKYLHFTGSFVRPAAKSIVLAGAGKKSMASWGSKLISNHKYNNQIKSEKTAWKEVIAQVN